MSDFEVLRRAFGYLAVRRLHLEVDRLVVKGLRAVIPGPGGLFVLAGQDAGLSRNEAVDRAAVCLLGFAANNLSDDLSDGECDYLPPAPAQAVVLILGSLFTAALCDHQLPPAVQAAVLRDMLAAQEAQVLETTTASWDAARLGVVTDGIAGRQWSAYLRVLWAGTRMAPLAPDVARDVGRAALLSGDIATADPRYAALPPSDRRVMLRAALTSLRALESLGTSFTRSLTASCRPVLEKELTRGPHGADAASGDQADDHVHEMAADGHARRPARAYRSADPPGWPIDHG